MAIYQITRRDGSSSETNDAGVENLPFRFMDQPRELRNRVYRHLLLPTTIAEQLGVQTKKFNMQPAILQVLDRKVRREMVRSWAYNFTGAEEDEEEENDVHVEEAAGQRDSDSVRCLNTDGQEG